ncbi:MAG: hypothetical protein IAF02_00270 [Anaerolineae bacterium]|nr:hypothetical protein [Anaerolineae bacterium]
MKNATPLPEFVIDTVGLVLQLHDRLIAATAKALDAKLITNDLKIQASSFVQTIW